MKNLATALFCFAALGACVDAADPSDDSVTADPRIATNGLLPGYIHPNTLAAKVLTGANITSTAGMEDTTQHSIFTSYIVGCALAPNQCVTSTFLTTTYTYCGSVGIAPAWTTRALTTAESMDVSSCVIARANETGTTVTISIRGDNAAYATTTDEAANYNVEEAAFYGNIWTTTANSIHACDGVDQVRDGDTYGDLAYRHCGEPNPNNPGYTMCGFVYDGQCSDQCVRNSDHYSSCVDANGFSHGNIETIRLYGTAP